ncbi:hypothetical protein [Micromonospora sp. IBHARD004]|uniref:hypothetical protein n=1 Tax=Micromonospora sp. IBHARD004 TaxID=3457764 RepID=UPI0040593B4E
MDGRPTVWAEARLGYPDHPVTTWVLAVAGTPRLTAQVHRDGSTVTASPDARCVVPPLRPR